MDIVESWIMEKGLDDQIHFLQTVSSAADLLATPKIQLMQVKDILQKGHKCKILGGDVVRHHDFVATPKEVSSSRFHK